MSPTSRTNQIVGVVADATGRTDEEIKAFLGGIVLLTALIGILRVVDAVTEARSVAAKARSAAAKKLPG